VGDVAPDGRASGLLVPFRFELGGAARLLHSVMELREGISRGQNSNHSSCSSDNSISTRSASR
jgi:hypothetical protein